MRTKHTPFLKWTKKEIFLFCVLNGYGEPKFNGNKKVMYAPASLHNWTNNILTELAFKINYIIQFN